jgi:hypothetical protein
MIVMCMRAECLWSARYDPLIAANNANSKSLLPRHGRLHFTLGASSAVLRPEPR